MNFDGASDPRKTILAERKQLIGPSLSLSYREPLLIVKGRGQYLFDAQGRRYLDCVNNVCHVGHCHPRVVEAAARQMAELNTNTRYLHPNIVEYARRLTATLPDPLEVCFFVNSGSEANDLALRLARTHTGSRDMIVLEHAYHGHTGDLIEISPYKFDGKGGAGAPPHTHKVPIPDRYRGKYRDGDGDLGALYADEVAKAAEGTGAQGLAGFIAESIVSCGGQVVLPDGYLAASFDGVRSAGGVCIADEVQVGFGRVGSCFWGFQLQGVVPDVVTAGKPIGNGHPLAAVITTREIAASFCNGMEYFNTFGGNPVSCAVGLEVLRVIEEEGLQQHAADVGDSFLKGLRELMTRHAVIGDVRGCGLFIGIELVSDRDSREPAGVEAAELVEAMKERGILLSTDGPYHNVIKIKPPLVFSREDGDRVVEALDQVFTQNPIG